MQQWRCASRFRVKEKHPAYLGYQIQMTVNLTVEMLGAEKTIKHNSGLQAPLMIEWE